MRKVIKGHGIAYKCHERPLLIKIREIQMPLASLQLAAYNHPYASHLLPNGPFLLFYAVARSIAQMLVILNQFPFQALNVQQNKN